MNAIDLIRQSAISSTNALCREHGLRPVYRPNPIQKHTTYLNLGVLGDEVEAVVEWNIDHDQEKLWPDLVTVVARIPECTPLHVLPALSDDVTDSIKREIALGWSE